MRLLITGSAGQLGSELAARALLTDDVDAVALDRSGCDITQPAAIAAALAEHRPEVLINCAGWTNVDGAEDNPDGAFIVNALGPRLLAEHCAARGVLIVQPSTDYVFDGTAGSPIDEHAAPAPLGAYGRSKLAGEQHVRSSAERHQIVRTSWLFGRDGPNFVLTMLRLAERQEVVRVVADQEGTPTWTGDLAEALLRLARRGTPGTYHLTNSGTATWHAFATEIFRQTGAACTALPITTSEYPVRAQRPRYSVLDNRAWRELGEALLPRWQDGLAAYLAERGAVTPARP